MRSATLIPDPAVLTLEAIQPEASSIKFFARASRAIVSCPNGDHPSGRVHSWYIRHLNDLPWQGLTVRLHIHTRRWFCENPFTKPPTGSGSPGTSLMPPSPQHASSISQNLGRR